MTSRRAPKTGGVGTKRKASSPAESSVAKKRRYEPTVLNKDESVWQKEWSGFMSNVKMKEQGATMKVQPCLEDDEMEHSTFSYLFHSRSSASAEKHKKAMESKTPGKKKVRGGLDELAASKMVKTLTAAQRAGYSLPPDANRKERRRLLHLTKTEEMMRYEEEAKRLANASQAQKLQNLMDPKLAWYQQEPYPLDLITEKLVQKKALKHGKQLGLVKYNYLLIHPSWLASRARKRALALAAPTGKHLYFREE